MTKLQQQKGFTLVELAIVITIIGLLIGGILKGQQLITNARVTAVINQVKATEAASTTFYDSYGAQPGDMSGTNKIPGCTSTFCDIDPTTANNGVIGQAAWDVFTPQVTGPLTASATTEKETVLFWYYLAATGMISSVDGSSPTGQILFGEMLPATKLGGGFLVGHSNGASGSSARGGGPNITITGNVLSFVVNPAAADTVSTGQLLLTPAIAAQIDRKMDDGLPGVGDVQGTGVNGASGCTTSSFATTANYFEGNKAKDCDLVVHIQG